MDFVSFLNVSTGSLLCLDGGMGPDSRGQDAFSRVFGGGEVRFGLKKLHRDRDALITKAYLGLLHARGESKP
jgi:hypothetical protein